VSKTAKLTAAHRTLLERAAEVCQGLDSHTPTAPSAAGKQENIVFDISFADGQKMTGVSAGDVRAFVEFLFNGLNGLADHDDTLQLLQAANATLLSMEPRNPMQALLIIQMLANHRLSMAFSRRAMRCQDLDMAGRLSERVARLMDIGCRQMETLMRLRGEGTKQHVVVSHINVEPGAQAMIGQVNRGEGYAKRDEQIKGDKSPQAMNALRHGHRSVAFRQAMRLSQKLMQGFDETLKSLPVSGLSPRPGSTAEMKDLWPHER
jgi:hypothetical protein